MSSLSRANWTRIHGLFCFFITAGGSLLFGLILWFVVLAADLLLGFDQVSRHMHQSGYRMFSILGAPWGLGLVYGMAFFLAAFLAGRWRWSCRPGLAAFVAYAAYLLFCLPGFEWRDAHAGDFLILLTPLLTAPLGGLAGYSLFAKTCDRQWPVIVTNLKAR